jgi:hypothetical protein
MGMSQAYGAGDERNPIATPAVLQSGNAGIPERTVDVTSSLLSGSRRKRVVYSGWLAVGIGLIGVPLVVVSLWPGIDHTPYSANIVVMAFGLSLSTVSYTFGRASVAGMTENRPRPVSGPGALPSILAGVFFAVAVLALIISAA